MHMTWQVRKLRVSGLTFCSVATGTVLLVVKRCRPARVWMPAQNSRSVSGLLYPTAVRDDRCEHKHCQGPVDIDPPLVSYRHGVGYRRSPGNLTSRVTRSTGE